MNGDETTSDNDACGTCGGSGTVAAVNTSGYGMPFGGTTTCPTCSGSGNAK